VESVVAVADVHALVDIPGKCFGAWEAQCVGFLVGDGNESFADVDGIPEGVLPLLIGVVRSILG
jgi:hypothetical protein